MRKDWKFQTHGWSIKKYSWFNLVEILWPSLHQAWKKKEHWGGCNELDATVQEHWDGAKRCLQAYKKVGCAVPPILTVMQFRGA